MPLGLEVTHAVPAGEEDALDGGIVDGLDGGIVDGLDGGIVDGLDGLDGLDDRLVDGVSEVWLDALDVPAMFAVFGAGLTATACPLHAVAIRHSTAAASGISTLEYL